MTDDIRIPIKALNPYSHTEESGVTLSNVKPVNIAELSKLANELHPVPSYTNLMHDVLMKSCNQFDNEFRKVLDKHHISEDNWKKYGKIKCEGKLNKCYYRGKYIFFYTNTDFSMDESGLSGKFSFYAGEPAEYDE